MKKTRFLLLIFLELLFAIAGLIIALIFLNDFLLTDFFSFDAFLFSLLGFAAGSALAALMWLATRLIRGLRTSKALKVIQVLKGVSWPQALLIALAAGLAEELLFRGALRPLMGILISSIIFTLLHAYSKLYVAVAFIISVFMGYLYLWTGNLATPIFAHATYDFIIIALLKLGYFKSQAPAELECPESKMESQDNPDL